MNRYFFDFDDLHDEHGILISSLHAALNEALQAMPEYLADLLARGDLRNKVTCKIRENDKTASYKISFKMRIEDEHGHLINLLTIDPNAGTVH